MAVDFEKFTSYPENGRPAFQESFDLTGNSGDMKRPGKSDTSPAMFYSADTASKTSLELVLGVPRQDALDALKNDLMEELKESCSTFQSHDRRHVIRSERIYNSFDLPFLSVDPEVTQRDSKKRLKKVGLDERDLKGSSLLDLGSNIGGSLFEAQNFGPVRSLGVEFDENKVVLASKIAAYNGLKGVDFLQADIDEVTVEKLNGPYDVVFCLAIIDHVKKKDQLYDLLGDITTKVLFYEGNGKTPREDIEAELKKQGFKEVNYIGLCDDDCLPDNNTRPVYIARK